ncbi:MAG: DUF2029 domain-containing protein, partial [Ignavibacteria bacterium]|nr:DUF2029 domain-containing protein [Ignavibacteria bacterium]
MYKIKILLLILTAAAAGMMLYYSSVKSTQLTHGFGSYYTHSRLLAEGGDMTAAYDSLYFHSKMSEYGFGRVKDLPNLPSGALIMLPLSFLEPVKAKVVWSAISLLALAAAVLLLFRTYNIPFYSTEGLVLLTITFVLNPLYSNMLFGQVYTLILLLSAIALYGRETGKPIVTAISLTLMIVFKGYGLYPLAALLIMKEYRTVIYTVVFTAMVLLAALPVFGISAWQMYYTEFYSVVSYGTFAGHTAYQTFGSLLMHTFSSVPKVFLYYTAQAAGVMVLFYITRRMMPLDKTAALTCAIALNILFSPAAENYHYVLLLPLI